MRKLASWNTEKPPTLGRNHEMSEQLTLTGKQMRHLRSRAVTLKPAVQVGKGGIGEELIATLAAALNAHELVKVRVLNNCPLSVSEVREAIEALGCDVVQTIGHNLVVFAEADEPENRVLSKEVLALI
jgi:RNA-binding protein